MTQNITIQMQSDQHLGVQGDLCFINGKVISVAEDSMLRTFTTNKSKMETESQLELKGETYAVCSNQVDKLIMGGQNKLVEIYNIQKDDKLTEEHLAQPFTAMKFQSDVKKVQFNGTKWVLGMSEDEHMSIFNTETQKTLHCKPGHAGCSVKSGSVDPTGQYVATTGSDGNLNIYKFIQNQESIEFLTKIKICDKKVPADRTFDLEVQWLSEETLLIPGKKELGFLQKDEDNEKVWEACYEERVAHSEEISTVMKLSNEILASYSQADSNLKVWRLSDEGCACLYNMKFENPLIAIRYDNQSKTLACMDNECKIGVLNKDLVDGTPGETEEEVDEIDVNDLDLAELAEDEEMEPVCKDDEVIESKPQQEEELEVMEDQEIKDLETFMEKSDAAESKNPEQIVVPEVKVAVPTNVASAPAAPVKQATVQKDAGMDNDYILMDPQAPFMTNCKLMESNTSTDISILSWNIVGTVAKRVQNQYTSIDVDFTDRQFHRNLCLNDDFGASMCCMNYSGLLLGSKAEVQDQDQYEEDMDIKDNEIDKKASHLYFKPFNDNKNTSDWHYQMHDGESIEAIAQGSEWVAACTDAGYVRVFSLEGIQKYVLSQSQQIVTMAGYENLMVMIYHAGPPLFEIQNLKCKIIDTKTQKTLYDEQCPVSRGCDLTWVGFSEEGMLTTMDSNGIIMTLNFKTQQWVPLLDLKLKFQENFRQIWIVGFMENELLAIQMLRNEEQPPLSMKSKNKKITLSVPFLAMQDANPDAKDQTLGQIEEQHFREQTILDHEQYRKDVWEPNKLFRSNTDNERFLSDSILEAKEIVQKKKDLDKHILNAIRKCIMEDQHDKVMTYLDLLHFTQSLKLCVKLCNSLNQNALAQAVSIFIQDKDAQETLKQQYQKAPQVSAMDSRQVSLCMQMKQTNDKPDDLSKFSVVSGQVAEKTYEMVAAKPEEAPESQEQIQEQPKQATGQPTGTVTVKTNMFAKSHDLAKKKISQKNGDIFSDLQKKRQNPFANGMGQNKQRKLY